MIQRLLQDLRVSWLALRMRWALSALTPAQREVVLRKLEDLLGDAPALMSTADLAERLREVAACFGRFARTEPWRHRREDP